MNYTDMLPFTEAELARHYSLTASITTGQALEWDAQAGAGPDPQPPILLSAVNGYLHRVQSVVPDSEGVKVHYYQLGQDQVLSKQSATDRVLFVAPYWDALSIEGKEFVRRITIGYIPAMTVAEAHALANVPVDLFIHQGEAMAAFPAARPAPDFGPGIYAVHERGAQPGATSLIRGDATLYMLEEAFFRLCGVRAK